MQNNSENNKRVSIQSMLNGLSFYCNDTKEYSLRRVDTSISEKNVIDDELKRVSPSEIVYYMHGVKYVMIPAELFDEQQCERYLAAKSFYPSATEEITYHVSENIAYISIVASELISHLRTYANEVFIAPAIAKAVRYSTDGKGACMVLSHNGSEFDMVCAVDGKMVLCDSFKMSEADDIQFCVVKAQDILKTKKIRIIILKDDAEILARVLHNYNITLVSNENYSKL